MTSEPIFIHVPKTAGASITAALGLPRDHATARQWVERIGLDEWRRRLAFAVARHPLDRFVSAWTFFFSAQPGRAGWQPARESREAMLRHGPKMEDFVRAGQSAMFEVQAFRPQVDWLSPAPRLLLRFEELDQQFREFFGIELPHFNGSEHAPWGDLLTADMRRRLAEIYAADFSHLGYHSEM